MMDEKDYQDRIGGKKRIVVKIGSSSLAHPETSNLDLGKMEILTRELVDLRNRGKDVVLVTSGAVMAGKMALRFDHVPVSVSEKQACASVGQAKLMMIYQKLFSEYDVPCGQILLTKSTMRNEVSRTNAKNTFEELFSLGAIPIVNENDTVATSEIDSLAAYGDNDRLSAVVAAVIGADLLILLSDIDGLYTDDPHMSDKAEFVDYVEDLDESLMLMGKESTGTAQGSGGMATKLSAAKIARAAGCDMIIASGRDFHMIGSLCAGSKQGTFFRNDEADAGKLEESLEQWGA